MDSNNENPFGDSNPFIASASKTVEIKQDNPFLAATSLPCLAQSSVTAPLNVLAPNLGKPLTTQAAGEKINPFLFPTSQTVAASGTENPFLSSSAPLPSFSVVGKENLFFASTKESDIDKENPFIPGKLSEKTDVGFKANPFAKPAPQPIFGTSIAFPPTSQTIETMKPAPSNQNIFSKDNQNNTAVVTEHFIQTNPTSNFFSAASHNAKSIHTSTQSVLGVLTESNNVLKPLIDKGVGLKTSKRTTERVKSVEEMKNTMSRLAFNLKSVICTDSGAKYDVLDKIDKEIRKNVESRSGKRFRALKGSCLDMCPEKERYFRDDKHQVSPFELRIVQEMVSDADGCYPSLDHSKAVKEYSRSSADQEEPLSHQLRPASVLKCTMEYLIFNIMDIKYIERTDWFDFLWNRTRAIRKDITQQNLSSLETISIMEKCARFHIFCSHLLCDRELHVFDPKLNLENLTKCLQTLKHMYEDQWKEKGRISKNEAEFRCYQILLNLNDGDILREAMCFSEEVRNSDDVNFALKAFSAVRDNNYVRFFKLLNSTTLLNGCLLRPYFDQMRGSALAMMVKTFTPNKNTEILYSLENFTKILAFNDAKEASDFCNAYGLKTKDMYIYFNRSSFIKPEEPFPQTVSFVVEEKFLSSISEVINNGPREHEFVCMPTYSFSTEGMYTGTYHILDDNIYNENVIVIEDENVSSEETIKEEIVQDSVETAEEVIEIISSSEDEEDHVSEANTTKEITIISTEDSENIEDVASVITDTCTEISGEESSEEDVDVDDKNDPDFDAGDSESGSLDDLEGSDSQHESDKEDIIMFLREDYFAFVDELINEEISSSIANLYGTIVTEVRDELKQSEGITNQMVAMICIEEARMAVTEVIDEEQEKAQEDFENSLNEDSVSMSENVIEDAVSTIVRTVCDDVYQEEVDSIEKDVLIDQVEKASSDFFDKFLDKEAFQVAGDVISETSLERKQYLEERVNQFGLKLVKRMFFKWINAFKRQQFIKSSLIDFPPLAPFISTKQAVQKLHPDGDISYSLPNFSKTETDKSFLRISENDESRLSSHSVLDDQRNVKISDFSKPLSALMEDGMSFLFFKKFHEHCLYCERLRIPPADPNGIINFYNNALGSVEGSISENLDNESRNNVHCLISTLKLPNLEQVASDWDTSCTDCEVFISKVTSNNNSVLLSRVNNILNKYLDKTLHEVDPCFPWSEVLEECIFIKMSSMYCEEDTSSTVDFSSYIKFKPKLFQANSFPNPLKEHINMHRGQKVELEKNILYKDEMKQKKFAREYHLRKSLDSVNSELNQIEAATIRKDFNLRDRTNSVQDLFVNASSVLDDINSFKKSDFKPFSDCSDSFPLSPNDKEPQDVFTIQNRAGSKRSFEHSIMECLKELQEHRSKSMKRDEYWRRVVNN